MFVMNSCVGILALLAGGRHDKRALDATDAYLRFACIGLPDRLGACDHLLFAVLFDAGYVGLDKYWPTAVIKQHRVPGEARFDWSHFDADRACVECFFGHLKHPFRILPDDAFRLQWSKLTFWVAMLNFRHRFRGYALSNPPQVSSAPSRFPRTHLLALRSGGLLAPLPTSPMTAWG
jgi:hypothetical protein